MTELARQAILNMLSHIIFIIITWQIIQSVRLDSIFKKMRNFEARLVIIFITITIGTSVSNFFLDLLNWTNQITYLF